MPRRDRRWARAAGRVWLAAWLFLGFLSFPLALYSPALLRLLLTPLGRAGTVGRGAAFLGAFPLALVIALLGWLPLELWAARAARR